MKLLLVEDDPTIAKGIIGHLSGWGYQCVAVRDLRRVLEEFVEEQPQLVLMDLMLPGCNGFHWCRKIRQISNVPILFLSSADDNMNFITAIQMGGDDFLAKPFELSVLTAKVQALLRRAYDFGPPNETLCCDDMVLNVERGTVERNGVSTTLTRNEQQILQVLLEHRGHTVSREKLMQRLWENAAFVDENTLSVNVARLRRTLQSIGVEDFIRTRKGMGYVIE